MSTFTRTFSTSGLASGLDPNTGNGTLEFTILDADGVTVRVTRRNTGIVEVLGAGAYRVAVPNFDSAWPGWILWTTGGGTVLEVLEEFQALASLAAAIAAQVTSDHGAGSYVPDNATLAAIKVKTDLIPSGGLPSATDWTPTRAGALDYLDVPVSSRAAASAPAALLAALAQGVDLGVVRGDTLNQPITGLGSLVGRTRFWFTLKRKDSDSDNGAMVQIVEGVGLVRLMSKAGVAGQGSLSVTDQGAGNVTLHLDAVATAQLLVGTWIYDFQILTASGVRTIASGSFAVIADVTRSTS